MIDFAADRDLLITEQKYGRPNQATPAKWQAEYKDYHAPADGTTAQPVGEKTVKEEVVAGPPVVPSVAPNGTSEAAEIIKPQANGEDNKKRRRHEGETPEEKVERKRRKKEKKERKAAKKAAKEGTKASASEESD